MRLLQTTLILMTAATSLVAFGQVQKWVDEDGKIHYGSKAPKNVSAKPLVNAPITSALGTSQIAEETAEELAERSVSQPDFSQRAAINNESVVLYTTSWCGYCKKARAYMALNGIVFEEQDIEKDRFAKFDYRRFSGSGVPLLVMGDQNLRGFSEQAYDRFFDDQ